LTVGSASYVKKINFLKITANLVKVGGYFLLSLSFIIAMITNPNVSINIKASNADIASPPFKGQSQPPFGCAF